MKNKYSHIYVFYALTPQKSALHIRAHKSRIIFNYFHQLIFIVNLGHFKLGIFPIKLDKNFCFEKLVINN